ncbi:kinase-like domain-containing protein [Aspergillus stella-maris]|uniref:kinase-like domain-containing protein n=1 Tax=Aspergillus stella-maris TaxID=1810926 RepID=UPI003CCE0BE8
MDFLESLTFPFKLEIKDLGDRRREVTYEADVSVTTLWTRKRFFGHKETVYKNVYLDESTSGQLRVVKEIYHQTQNKNHNKRSCGNRCLELEAAARIAKGVGPKYTRHFVEFLGWFEIPNGVSLVLEYCELGDIEQFFPSPLSEEVARTIAGQLLEGIEILHDMGIAHRDIKPQNVLVAQADPIHVKIADFGVSKYLSEKTSLRSRVGTPEYMAPELLFDTKKESEYSNAVDIWSLGCLLFYLLTKKLAFPGFHELDEYYQGGASFPERVLVQHGIELSGTRFIQGLLSPMPNDRPKASKVLVSEWEISADEAQDIDIQCASGARPMPEDIELSDSLGPRTVSGISLTNSHQFNIPSNMSQLPMDYHCSQLLLTTSSSKQPIDTRTVRALLESGADPNRMINGHTSLHHAARQGSPETVLILLEYGADTWIKTSVHDETALHLATEPGDSTMFLDILDLLVARGIDINAQDGNGNTVLHLVIARLESVEPLGRLLGVGARMDLLGRGGMTPLQYAIELDREDKAAILLERGADPNVPCPDGRRPLHRAIASKGVSIGLIRLLVEKGAEIDAQDYEGKSPLYEAVRQNRPDIVNYLVDQGASCKLGSAIMEMRLQWILFRRGLPWPL